MPAEYTEFNTKFGAPNGWPASRTVPAAQRLEDPRAEYGPFAFQIASGTRVFEYPYTFFKAQAQPGARVLDVGGCVGGLQYVLAMEGYSVVNVDPFHEGADGWPAGSARTPIRPDLHDKLNKVFGTNVELVRASVQDADLPAESFDRAVCVSVIEHLGEENAQAAARAVARLLKPGGLFVVTIDLFLDLKPFGVLDRNCYGTNIDVSALVAASGLELVEGDRSELFGYPEFDAQRIVEQLDEILVAPRYPVVSQAIVLRKPE